MRRLVLIVALLVLAIPSFAEIIGPNTDQTCTNGVCNVKTTGGQRFVQNDNEVWENIGDYIDMQITDNTFRYNWTKDGIEKYVVFQPIIKYSGTVYDFSAFEKVASGTKQSLFNEQKAAYHEFELTIDKVPVGAKASLQNIGFNITDTNTEISIDGTRFLLDNFVSVDMFPKNNPNFTVTLDSKTALIGNITNKGTILYDPTITTITNQTGSVRAWLITDSTSSCLNQFGPPHFQDFWDAIFEYDANDYISLGASDNDRAVSFGANNNCLMHMYNYTIIPFASMNWMKFTWEGHGNSGGCSNDDNILVWNATNGNEWEVTDVFIGSSDTTVSVNVSGSDGIVNASDNSALFAVNCDDVTTAQFRADYAELEYEAITNAAPVINNATINVRDFGEDNDVWIIINATDSDGDSELDTCWRDGGESSNAFSGGNCSIDVPNDEYSSFLFYVNDSSNATTSAFNVSFTFSNSTLNQTDAFSHTLSNQKIERSNTFNFSGGSHVAVIVNYSTPSGGTPVGSEDLISEIDHTTNVTFLTEWTGDFITELTGVETLFQNQTASSTQTQQFLINTTHLNSTNSQSFTFVSVDLSASCTNTATSDVATGATQVSANCSWVGFDSDYITEVEGVQTAFQNRTAEFHNTTIQYYINETHINTTNSQSFMFSNIDFSSACENFAGAQNVATGTTQIQANCSWAGYSADFVTETRNRYNITDANVTLNENSNGYGEFSIVVDATGYDLTNLTVNATPLLPSNWVFSSNTTENYTLSINSGVTTLTNRSVQTSLPLIINLTIASDDCAVGMSVFGTHCRNSSTYIVSDITYTLRDTIVLFNVSDVIVRDFVIDLTHNISYYPDWTLSTQSILETARNTTATDVSATSNTTNVVMTIGTDHGGSSISVLGQHTARIKYQTSIQAGGGGGSGGGGGGGGAFPKPLSIATGVCGNNQCELGENITTCFADCSNVSWTVVPSSFNIIGTATLSIGDEFVPGEDPTCLGTAEGCNILLQNPGSEALTLRLFFEGTGDGSEEWAFWATQEGALLTEIDIVVPAGNTQSPGKLLANFHVTIPQNTPDGVYTFNIITQHDGARQVIPVQLQIGAGIRFTIADDIAGFLITPIVTFDRLPLANIFTIPALYLIGLPLLFFTTKGLNGRKRR